MDAMRQSPKLVTVFGGTGFLGRHVVRSLAARGYRVRVAVRRPNLGFFLRPLGVVGQIQLVQANLRFDESIRSAVAGADAVVNLVGILQESGRQGFHEVQAAGPQAIAEATPPGIPIVHVSAIGADLRSPSQYARSKAQGEAAVASAHPGAVILRPSLLFGQGDSFFNRFAGLARALPVLPLAGADTRFQPVFVGDVAEAAARAVDGVVPGGIYELGGPEIRTLRELVDYVLAITERRRLVLALPVGAARAQARLLEIVDALTLGLLPDALKLTRDQVDLLQVDNVVSAAAEQEGRTLKAFGIVPCAMEAIVPGYLTRFRKTGQFEIERAA
ncbi:complex I NDUFA9 subunit family protein [uncultured Enterovirga sp.]|uniref:complex I NDUFA9 subunit family protein n=1 Tax=uncultured Enterovirga sp. TaxID=2026352 RepID=UPI0035CA663D